MSSFEIGASRPISAVQVTTVGAAGKSAKVDLGPASAPVSASAPASANAATPAAATQVATSDAVKAGAAPVDQERVQTIRHAVETGKYPIVPAKIADAMIAAGMLLRSPK